MANKPDDTAVADRDEKKNALATMNAGAGAALPAFMADKAAKDAGKGTSQDAADNLVPMVYLLQSGSPQAKKRDPAYIEGAEEGDIWLKNSGLQPTEIVKGDDGLLVQPCFFFKEWVEWKPNRGGYAGRHEERPADAEQKEIEVEGKLRTVWMRPNGNVVVETRQHIVLVHLEAKDADGKLAKTGSKLAYAIPMAGSQHTPSRAWMARMNAKSIPGVDGPAPSWACLYRLKPKGKQNEDGSWVIYDIIDAGWVQTAEEYEAGARLHGSFASGEKVVEAPMDETHQGGGAAAAGDDAKM
jgi:hypothetical protein